MEGLTKFLLRLLLQGEGGGDEAGLVQGWGVELGVGLAQLGLTLLQQKRLLILLPLGRHLLKALLLLQLLLLLLLLLLILLLLQLLPVGLGLQARFLQA